MRSRRYHHILTRLRLVVATVATLIGASCDRLPKSEIIVQTVQPAAASTWTITGATPASPVPNQTVTLYGSGFFARSNIVARVSFQDGTSLDFPISVESSTKASVFLTGAQDSGVKKIQVFSNSTLLGSYVFSSTTSTQSTTPSVVATPTASPLPGTYTSAQAVTLATSTAGATIYYTTNGSPPDTSSSVYSAPIMVAVNQTVKAFAVKPNDSDSAVASFDYTITGTAQAPTFTPAAGGYGPAQSVTLSSPTPGAIIYYTLDGTIPTTASSVYSSAITVSSSQTIKAIATKALWDDSSIISATYSINGSVATPTVNVSAGTYNSQQSVTLSSSTSGASIYYTLDGSAPSSSSTSYMTPITISNSQTLRAIATKANFIDSAVLTVSYTIQPPVHPPTLSVAGGTYLLSPTVVFSSETSGAEFYYTLDGSTPTCAHNGTETSAPQILIPRTTTLKVIACKPGYTDSAVTTASYDVSWLDKTTNSAGASSSCGTDTSRCTYRHLASNTDWTPIRGYDQWPAADSHCASLNHNGLAGWRLPTVHESRTAFSADISSLPGLNIGRIWTSELPESPNPWCEYYGGCAYTQMGVYDPLQTGKTSDMDFVCLRDSLPKISFATPSPSWVNPNISGGGSSSFSISYMDATSVNLTADDITLTTTGTASAVVSSVTGNGTTWLATISTFSGMGSIKLTIRANTALNSYGSATAATSMTFIDVDGPLWTDVTKDGNNEPSTCSANPSLCTFKLSYSSTRPAGSSTQWRRSDGIARTYSQAMAYCESLGAGWHMPFNSEFAADLADGLYDRQSSALNLNASGYWAQNTDIATCASDGGCLWSLQNRNYGDRWVEYSAEIICAK